MDDIFILNENGNNAAHSGLLRLHDAVGRRESERPEAALSPEELLARFRAADPTRNAAFLPWLLRTYAAGGYRLEDLSKAHDTLVTFARLRGLLPNTTTIDGEIRNPRKLGSHMTLASLWKAVGPLVEAERLAQEEEAGEQPDTDKERALLQSRVLHRSNRMVVAVPMTMEASCWWGQGTQWCTAARNNSAFEQYHSNAPLIVICLRKNGDLPARKLQLHVHSRGMQFMDENDARVSKKIILDRWPDLERLLHWAVNRNRLALAYVPEPLRTETIYLAILSRNGMALAHVPEPLRTEAMCTTAVGRDGWALQFVPLSLRTEAICAVAVEQNGRALRYVPEPLRTEVVCLAALKQTGLALEYVPERLRTKAICTVAVEQDGLALEYVPKPIRMEAVCLAAVEQDGRALEFVPEPLRTEVMFLAAVEQNGLALRFVPEHLRTEAICTTAVYRDGRALRFVPEHLRTEAICLTTVKQNGQALEYVPEPLRTEAVCLAAVGRNGWALKDVPEPLRTEAMYLTAVEQNGMALTYVPEPLRTNTIRLSAITQNGQKYISKNGETNIHKSYDLILDGLEDCLNNLQPSHFMLSP